MSKKKTPKRKRAAAVRWSDFVLPLLNIGDQMSNICFNLKQDSKLPDTTRRSMAQCQEKWDAARRTADAAVRKWQNAKAHRQTP